MAGTVFRNVYFAYEFLDDTECITVTMLKDPNMDANGPNTVVRHDEAWFNVLPRLKQMETPHLGSFVPFEKDWSSTLLIRPM